MCLCVCLSVKSHIASGASVHPENTVTFSVGNVGGICGVFSENASFQSYGTSYIVRLPLSQPFSLWEYARESAIIRAIPMASAAQAQLKQQHSSSMPWGTATADLTAHSHISLSDHSFEARGWHGECY